MTDTDEKTPAQPDDDVGRPDDGTDGARGEDRLERTAEKVGRGLGYAAGEAPILWLRIRLGWRYLTGWHDFRTWHSQTLQDAWLWSDRTVVLLGACAFIALSNWWQIVAAGGDLTWAGWAFAGWFVGCWYAWNIVSTVRRDRRRLIHRLTKKVTGSLSKSELVKARRGDVRVGHAQGLGRRGVRWERFGGYPVVLHATYSPALLDDSNPTERDKVTRAVLGDLEGTDEQPKTWRRYDVSFQPSSNQFTTRRLDPVPNYIQASDQTLIHPDGAVVGYTGEGPAIWSMREHLYIQGATMGGKSVAMRHLIISAIRGGHAPGGVYIMDGKQGDDYGALDGRAGVAGVADQASMWAAMFAEIMQLTEVRYQQARAAARSHGQIPKPKFDRVLVVMDECQNFVKLFGDEWTKLAREARAAEVWLIAATQRGDIKEAFPNGATRDQYLGLLHIGRGKDAGPEMMFGRGSLLAEQAGNLEPIKGRFLAVLDGRVHRGQAPFLPVDNDTDNPWGAALYPPLRKTAVPTAGTSSVTPGVIDAGPAPEPDRPQPKPKPKAESEAKPDPTPESTPEPAPDRPDMDDPSGQIVEED